MIYTIKQAIKNIVDWIQIKSDPVAYAKKLGVDIGKNVRLISIRSGDGTFGSEPYLVRLGNHVTVTGGVQFVTHDGGVWVFREKEPDIDVFGKITVGDNVFIGYGAIIMPNVSIGNNVVVGAGAVVTRDVASDSVVVGSPAKKIMNLDEYYSAIVDKKEYIRSLSQTEKKLYLINKFGLS